MADQNAMHAVFLQFAQRATGVFDVESILQDLAVAVTQVIDVDAAAVVYRDGDRMRLVYASSDEADMAERVQDALQQGPCKEAQASGQTVVEQDLALRGDRWPAFAERAVAGGLHSVASIPLWARDEAWGVLDIYRQEPGLFPAGDLEAARALAAVAVGYVVMAHDRDVARAAQRQLAHAATHDPLTGLPNRALLYDRLEHALASARRKGTGVAVVFLDLNGFKAINDTHGHQVGDQVLVEVASRLSGVLRGGDTLARMGGDEFVIICEGLTSTSPDVTNHALGTVISRATGALSRPARIAGQQLALSAALGIAVTGAGREDPDALLSAADAAMYDAKRSARHQDRRGSTFSITTDDHLPGASRPGQVINLEARQPRSYVPGEPGRTGA